MADDEAKPPAPKPTQVRARAKRKVRHKPPQTHGGTVEARIAHIVGLMREMKFRTGKTGPELAAKWGLSPATVAEHTAEASRIVRASNIVDRDSIGATIGAALDKAIYEAASEKQWRVVAQLVDVWAKIAGVVAPVKTEVTAMIGATATPGEARKVMRELFPGAVGPEDDAAPVAQPTGDENSGGPSAGTPPE